MDVYKALEAFVLPTMTDYQTDLTKHDRKAIEDNPKVPFIHYSGNTGTQILMLIHADKYPAKGEKVPYLFGRAGRDHILRQIVNMAQYFDRERYYAKRVYYFDGIRLKKINHAKGIEIAEKYTHAIRLAWIKAEEDLRKRATYVLHG